MTKKGSLQPHIFLGAVLQRHDECFSSVIAKEAKGLKPLVAVRGGVEANSPVIPTKVGTQLILFLGAVLQRHDECFSSVIQKEGKWLKPLVAEGSSKLEKRRLQPPKKWQKKDGLKSRKVIIFCD